MRRRGSSGTGGGSSVSVVLVSMLLLKEAVHVGAAVCYDCAEMKQHTQPCLPLTYKTTKWCDAKVNDDDGGDFANVVIKELCCAASEDECCDVDGGAIFGIVLLVILTCAGIALYLGRLSLPERPLGEYIDNWYDHLCEHELCMSKAYKMKVGMEQQTHTGVKKAGKV